MRISVILIVLLVIVACFGELQSFDRDIHVDMVFKKFHPALFYLKSSNQTVYESQPILQEVSNNFDDLLFFTSTRYNCELFYKLHEYLGTYELRLDPTIVYFSSEGQKYLFEGANITKQSITEFINKALNKQLPVYYKNQVLTEYSTGPVYVSNAKTFKEQILNSDKQYVVKFFAPWCQYCMELAPVYSQVAADFAEDQELYKDLIFLEIDATANQIKELPIQAYPTIYFFRRDKTDAVVRFVGERSKAEIKAWVQGLLESPVDNEL